MKLISWNVNGIRAILRKGFLEFIKTEKPDVICLQEIKATAEQAALSLPGYEMFWNPAPRPGYSGTAIFSRVKPLSVKNGMNHDSHDNEGRVMTAEFEDFFLVNVYVPNAKRDLSRLSYRHREWDVDFLAYLKKLEKRKPVIFCGDLNVAHQEIDLTHPETNRKNHGFTDEEREGFSNFIKAGFVDTFRDFYPGKGGHYTWWAPFANCRKRNIGWRIDYFLVSKSFRPRLSKAFILPDVLGSDHCPVGIVLKKNGVKK